MPELFKPAHHLDPAQSRQTEINDDNITRRRWWSFEERLRVRIADCIMPDAAEKRCQCIGNPIIIFDDVYGHGDRNSNTPELQANWSIERSDPESSTHYYGADFEPGPNFSATW